MKTTINGVEITQKITDVLADWYSTSDPKLETIPEIYARRLSEIQDCLTRILVETCEVDNEQIKKYLSWIIFIKDDLQKLIP